ncbi:MAG: dTMP kinase [Halothermotrichaceae bacterium]
MQGKLIVIESGTDASGKTTQYNKLFRRLKQEGHNITRVEYPNYNDRSSALVKMYLDGEFGEDPRAVNLYAASTFYAVDRFASYQKEWKELYEKGSIILADRYTTSNMIHQASKIEDYKDREEYLNWLTDLEFKKFGLPRPEIVLFLDMPPRYSMKLLNKRTHKDIHEKNLEYMQDTYKNACWIADKYNWEKIKCVEGSRVKSIDEIHHKVYTIIKRRLLS